MLDIKLIRDDPAGVERALATRGATISLAPVLEADTARRRLVTEAEELKAERNRASEAIGQARRRGEDAQAATARMREVSDRIKALDAQVKEADGRLEALLLEIPNVPHASVPVGASADDNVEVRRWGTPRAFAFAPQQHFEIGEALGILDFDRAAKIAKARFTVMWGAASRLSRALAQFMLDLHTRERGYQELIPPYLVSPDTMLGTGQLPKFEGDLFKTHAGDRELYLIPTAEVPLTALHRDEILESSQLPLKYVSFTPCFRSEAGSYGKDVRGLIRQHQFHKVELVKLSAAESSPDELETMTADAEEVLKRLGLAYRVVALSTGDLGFNAAKTYDLEVWLPGQGKYREISSCSNCTDYQARRLGIRYRPEPKAKPRFVHTLNGSGLAVGRTLIAVLENGQEADGSVTIPAALRPYMGGVERIEPAR
jgi:seryl-tRNA synthetase